MRVRAGLTIADINRIKYNAMMGRKASIRKPTAGTQGGSSAAEKAFEAGWYYNNYKMSMFIERLKASQTGFSLASVDPATDLDLLTALPPPLQAPTAAFLYQLTTTPATVVKVNEQLKAAGVTTRFIPHNPFVRCFQRYPDLFKQLLAVLKSCHVVLIGAPYLEDELKPIEWRKFIPVVPGGADVVGEVQRYIAGLSQGDRAVFLFAAVPDVARVITALQAARGSHFLIDTGSVWDNFVSLPHRREEYMIKLRQRWLGYYPELFTVVGGGAVPRAERTAKKVTFESSSVPPPPSSSSKPLPVKRLAEPIIFD